MKSDKILEELEILAEKLGLTVRYERGDFQGESLVYFAWKSAMNFSVVVAENRKYPLDHSRIA